MAYKKLLFIVLFISALFLVNIPGECLAQPIDSTKINKQDSAHKELAVDQQVETKPDRKINPVQGLRILELSENPTRTVIKATDLTRKEPAPTVATDKLSTGTWLYGFWRLRTIGFRASMENGSILPVFSSTRFNTSRWRSLRLGTILSTRVAARFKFLKESCNFCSPLFLRIDN